MNAEDTTDAALLLDRAAGGDTGAWGALLARCQARLHTVAAFRLDPRLRGRVDAADVVQEAFAAAATRRAEFFAQSEQPLFLWLRWMVGNALLELHRHHLGARMRDPRREVCPGLGLGCGGDGTRAALVAHLTAGVTGPATAAGRAEVKARLEEGLRRMDPADREVVVLRHYEQLSSAEAAQVLGIQERAAAKRYLRALERLREILSDLPGGLAGAAIMTERPHVPPPPPSPEPGATADGAEDALAALADDFAARVRRREHVTAEDYAADHPELAERIRKVFPAIAAIEGAYTSGVTVGVGAAPAGEPPNAIIGRYKLLERIGEGGFGVVYMAEQHTPMRRKVALKVIKPGMDSRQVVARFEAERQALAIMDHPNIAKVFDGGMTDSGRPYFVMELVKGEPITAYCDANQLAPRRRLELFVQVCNAVQHAHQKGVIHRDLKPTNVLVATHDTTPVVKVIDFGVAKALGRELTELTLFTGFAQLIGTPLYMSPEQAGQSSLDVDTRSDIYSLGVLLYELLTGTTPFDRERFTRAAQDEVRRIIREEDPPRPSSRFSTMGEPARRSISARRGSEPGQLARLVRGELDWIVMKALEKERNRRYETAGGLAADVKRYLDDEPVRACPASAAYRVRKFARRNKGPVLAASLVLLALVAGVVGTSWGLYRAGQQRGIVERQRDELAGRNEALRAANERARQAIEAVTSATAIDQLTRQQELRPEQAEFLDRMIRYYAEFAREAAATEQERFRQARAYDRMGGMNRLLGRSRDGEDAYRRAIALGKQLVADFPTRPEYLQQLATSYNNLSTLLHNAGSLPEAESACDDALAIIKPLAGGDPNRLELRQLLAGIQNNRGGLLQESGRIEEAEEAFTEALLIRQRSAADFPAGPNVRRALAMSHNNLGWLFYSTGRLEKALPAHDQAVAFQRQQVADRPDVPEFRHELAKYLLNLGNALGDSGRPGEAAAARAEARAICKQLVAEYSNRPEFRKEWSRMVGQDAAPAAEPREPQGVRPPEGGR